MYILCVLSLYMKYGRSHTSQNVTDEWFHYFRHYFRTAKSVNLQQGVVHEGLRKKDPFSYPLPCPQVSAFDQPPSPLRTSAFSIIHGSMVYAARWSHHRGILPLPHVG